MDIVVVAYRSGDVLPACIDSLQADPAAGHIYVVDNSPGYPLNVSAGPRLTILEPGENLGFGRAVNLLRGHASTPMVGIINPDLVAENGTLTACQTWLEQHPEVALLSPHVYVDGTLARTSENEVSLPRYLAHAASLDRVFGVPKSSKKHRQTHFTQAVNGAFMVARTDALNQVGWFDESLFLFGEETDLCRRLRKHGYKIAYLAVGHVDHLDGHSSGDAPFDVTALRRQARIEQLRRARGQWQATFYQSLLRK